jgi:hypothetical protein
MPDCLVPATWDLRVGENECPAPNLYGKIGKKITLFVAKSHGKNKNMLSLGKDSSRPFSVPAESPLPVNVLRKYMLSKEYVKWLD